MNPIKRFLIIYVVVYLAVGIGILATKGGPGLSAKYSAEGTNKHEHEHYLEITKSEPYKLWLENPDLHPLDAHHEAGRVFVEEYTSRPAFIAEERRRDSVELLFDFFNAFMVIVLAVRFGTGPLKEFLGGQVNDLRERMERLEQARNDAQRQRDEIQAQRDGVAQEEARISEETRQLLEHDLNQIKESTTVMLEQMAKETVDRQQDQFHLAAQRLKRELVTQAIDEIALASRQAENGPADSRLIDRYIEELGALR